MGPWASRVTGRTKLPYMPQAEGTTAILPHPHSEIILLIVGQFTIYHFNPCLFSPTFVLRLFSINIAAPSRTAGANLGQVVPCIREDKGLKSSLYSSLNHTPWWWAMSTREREAFSYLAQSTIHHQALCHRGSVCLERALLALVRTGASPAPYPPPPARHCELKRVLPSKLILCESLLIKIFHSKSYYINMSFPMDNSSLYPTE